MAGRPEYNQMTSPFIDDSNFDSGLSDDASAISEAIVESTTAADGSLRRQQSFDGQRGQFADAPTSRGYLSPIRKPSIAVLPSPNVSPTKKHLLGPPTPTHSKSFESLIGSCHIAK